MHVPPSCEILTLRKKKGEPQIEKENFTWHWCECHHQGKGLCDLHEPTDCNNVNRMKRHENTDSETDHETRKSETSERKMTLSKEMKTALLILGAFTEDKADAIVGSPWKSYRGFLDGSRLGRMSCIFAFACLFLS